MKSKHNLNLSVELDTYQEIKRTIPTGKVSLIVNNFLKEYLKKERRQKLKEAYQRTAQSKKMRTENKVWEGSVEDGITE